MQYSRSIVSITLATLVFAGSLHAQHRETSGGGGAYATPGQHQALPGSSVGSGAPAFSDLANGKTFITRGDVPKDNDALKPLRAHFNEADTDHNGRLDEKEYNAYINKSATPQDH